MNAMILLLFSSAPPSLDWYLVAEWNEGRVVFVYTMNTNMVGYHRHKVASVHCLLYALVLVLVLVLFGIAFASAKACGLCLFQCMLTSSSCIFSFTVAGFTF